MNFAFLAVSFDAVTFHGLGHLLSSLQHLPFLSIALTQATSHNWIISFLENAFVSYGYWIVWECHSPERRCSSLPQRMPQEILS